MTLYTLGGYTFEGNPQKMDPPESQKTVAEAETHGGSELFQWDASIVGESITLSWPTMSLTMYNQLRSFYLSPEAITFVPNDSYTYQVVVTNLDGDYFELLLESLAYRKDVELTLNIRSQTAI